MHFSLLARNTLDLRSRIRSAPLATLLHSLAKARSSHWSVACLRNPQQQRLHSTLPSAAMEPGVIAVIGTTGVGKSNLSIQLAKELDGEVINADALQVPCVLSSQNTRRSESQCSFLSPQSVIDNKP